MRSTRDLQAAIAVTRFGMGARPGEISEAATDPQGWLKSQIRPQGADLPDADATRVRLAGLRSYRRERQSARGGGGVTEALQAAQRAFRQNTFADFLARGRVSATTTAGFAERWALFWANHFAVSATKIETSALAGPYEAEAIRPNIFRPFGELLLAAETHPAMLLYLDQAQSIGPNSLAARRTRPGAEPRRTGLNENLAREILELHTVGVNGGYAQADVTEFARALTGYGIGGERDGDAMDTALFRTAAHEPGPRTVMGVSYPEGGREQAVAVLGDLALRPQTARFVCGKIARHFVADEPPPALAARLEKVWTSSGGDLARVAEALVSAPEAWAPTPAKFKTPYEFVVSSYRAVGAAPRRVRGLAPVVTGMGQRPFAPPSPRGWPDESAVWATPDGIIKRMQFAQEFAAAADPSQEPEALAASVLGARLSRATTTAVARAESRSEALSLLLMSPEFLRR